MRCGNYTDTDTDTDTDPNRIIYRVSPKNDHFLFLVGVIDVHYLLLL